MRHPFKIVLVLVVLYLISPFLAGVLAFGDRDGPKFYLEGHHSLLYTIGYESVRDDKPRLNPCYERPLFYGLSREKRELKNEQLKGLCGDG